MIRKTHFITYVFILGLFNSVIILAQPNNYKYGHGYGVYDSRYFRHGDKNNELVGGTCAQFLQLNSLSQCCSQRDDDCYMIHYDTRCYCDVFCDRSKIPDNSDCCPDAGSFCSGEAMQHIGTTKLQIIG